MWRAVRLVLDTGLHTMGWSREQAIEFFKANAAKTEHDITVEVDRYIVWPVPLDIPEGRIRGWVAAVKAR